MVTKRATKRPTPTVFGRKMQKDDWVGARYWTLSAGPICVELREPTADCQHWRLRIDSGEIYPCIDFFNTAAQATRGAERWLLRHLKSIARPLGFEVRKAGKR